MLYVPEEHVTEVITGHTFQTSTDRGVVRLADVVVPERAYREPTGPGGSRESNPGEICTD